MNSRFNDYHDRPTIRGHCYVLFDRDDRSVLLLTGYDAAGYEDTGYDDRAGNDMSAAVVPIDSYALKAK